jgi:hypothetical protein
MGVDGRTKAEYNVRCEESLPWFPPGPKVFAWKRKHVNFGPIINEEENDLGVAGDQSYLD